MADYFEKYVAEDFRILLYSLGYYRVSEEELSDKLVFCKREMKRYAVEYISPKNVDLKELGILGIDGKMNEILKNKADEIIAILNEIPAVKKCTVYGSIAASKCDELSDIDIEIDVSGYDNGKFMLEIVDS